MPVIQLETLIHAPREVCFDLSRSIELHMESTARTKERAVAGRTSGLIDLHETVTWEAVHLGVRQRLTVQIIQMESPRMFTDKMLKGAFKSMEHDHIFDEHPDGTLMKDVFKFSAPCGWLGRMAEKIFLNKYMLGFLLERNALIKQKAEALQNFNLAPGVK